MKKLQNKTFYCDNFSLFFISQRLSIRCFVEMIELLENNKIQSANVGGFYGIIRGDTYRVGRVVLSNIGNDICMQDKCNDIQIIH